MSKQGIDNADSDSGEEEESACSTGTARHTGGVQEDPNGFKQRQLTLNFNILGLLAMLQGNCYAFLSLSSYIKPPPRPKYWLD